LESQYGYKIEARKIEDLDVEELKKDPGKFNLFAILGWLGSICLALCGVITFIDLYPEIIPKWMMKLDRLFLNEIQKLHDEPLFWTETGLSKTGVQRVKEICATRKIDFNQITIKE
jgi:hypothetical protein